jgi:short-subunit dehydrogenase
MSLQALERLQRNFYMQTVLITGCSSGFGKDMVPLFLDNGWRVIATMRTPSAVSFESHRNLVTLQLDVVRPEDRKQIARYIREQLNEKLDCLINNAGYGLFGAFEDLSEADVRNQMEVNFFGLAFLTQELLPFLRNAKGKIINLSSLLGFWGIPLSSLYCASKHAVEGLSEALFHELRPLGVQVAVVEPGGYGTGFMEKSKWGEKSNEADSPYSVYTKAYQQIRSDRRREQDTGPSSSNVARTCLKLARMKKMPLRIRCKGETHMVYWLKRLLPESWFYGMLSMLFSRVLKKSNSASS